MHSNLHIQSLRAHRGDVERRVSRHRSTDERPRRDVTVGALRGYRLRATYELRTPRIA